MKKLLLAAVAAVLLASCATSEPVHRNITYFDDYNPLTEAGYLVSPSIVVPDNYTAIGQVLIIQRDGAEHADVQKKFETRDAFNESTEGIFDRKKEPKKKQDIIKYNSNTILKELAKEIKNKNGNGVIGLEIERISGTLYLSGYIIKKK